MKAALYEADVYIEPLSQADTLRAQKSDLDWSNLAEEIEAQGDWSPGRLRPKASLEPRTCALARSSP